MPSDSGGIQFQFDLIQLVFNWIQAWFIRSTTFWRLWQTLPFPLWH